MQHSLPHTQSYIEKLSCTAVIESRHTWRTSVWWLSTCVHFVVCMSHTRTVVSLLDVISTVSSYCSDNTEPVCPCVHEPHWPKDGSHAHAPHLEHSKLGAGVGVEDPCGVVAEAGHNAVFVELESVTAIPTCTDAKCLAHAVALPGLLQPREFLFVQQCRGVRARMQRVKATPRDRRCMWCVEGGL